MYCLFHAVGLRNSKRTVPSLRQTVSTSKYIGFRFFSSYGPKRPSRQVMLNSSSIRSAPSTASTCRITSILHLFEVLSDCYQEVVIPHLDTISHATKNDFNVTPLFCRYISPPISYRLFSVYTNSNSYDVSIVMPKENLFPSICLQSKLTVLFTKTFANS